MICEASPSPVDHVNMVGSVPRPPRCDGSNEAMLAAASPDECRIAKRGAPPAAPAAPPAAAGFGMSPNEVRLARELKLITYGGAAVVSGASALSAEVKSVAPVDYE